MTIYLKPLYSLKELKSENVQWKVEWCHCRTIHFLGEKYLFNQSSVVCMYPYMFLKIHSKRQYIKCILFSIFLYYSDIIKEYILCR